MMPRDFLPHGKLLTIVMCPFPSGTCPLVARALAALVAVVSLITLCRDVLTELSMPRASRSVHADSLTKLLMLLIGGFVLGKLATLLLGAPWRGSHAK